MYSGNNQFANVFLDIFFKCDFSHNQLWHERFNAWKIGPLWHQMVRDYRKWFLKLVRTNYTSAKITENQTSQLWGNISLSQNIFRLSLHHTISSNAFSDGYLCRSREPLWIEVRSICRPEVPLNEWIMKCTKSGDPMPHRLRHKLLCNHSLQWQEYCQFVYQHHFWTFRTPTKKK